MAKEGGNFRRGRKGALPEERTFRVKIEYLDENGAGVAFYNRRKIAVEKTLPGEEVLIRYTPHGPRKERVRLMEFLSTAPERVSPPCPHFAECGGCQLQHLSYPQQLQFKQQLIRRLLLTFPALKPIVVHPTEGMPQPQRYRAKCQMPFQTRGGAVVYGLYRTGTQMLIAVDDCLVESRDAITALGIVRSWAGRHQIPIYDPLHNSGWLRHLVVRRGVFTGQLMVVLVAVSADIPHFQTLLSELKSGLPSLGSVQLNVQDQKTNVILGRKNLVLWGQSAIEERLGEHRFRIYPNTFFQINPVQMLRLLARMKEVVPLQPTDTVVDLFCGVGAISLHVAAAVKTVAGIELSTAAVQAARENLELNGLRNVTFHAGNAEESFRRLVAAGLSPQVVIADPPRKGLEAPLIRTVAESRPRRVVYISCNPSSLVRDLEIFRQEGYVAQEIFPFDMFPQTHHVECLTVLHSAAGPGER